MLSAKKLLWMALLLGLAVPVLAEEPLPALPPEQESAEAMRSSVDEALPQLQPSTLPTLPPADVTSVTPNTMVSVTCFIGNPNNEDEVGSLGIFSAAQAARSCNETFFDCRGKCYGCYLDFDYGEEVCMDAAGKKYLR